MLEFPVDELGLHPAANPVALLEFRIETYTPPGAVVLDTATDTGSIAIAAANAERRLNNRILADA